jgi:retron-type reverse transcriptase
MKPEEYLAWKTILEGKYPTRVAMHEYLERFRETPFPVLFSLGHIGQIVGLRTEYLARIVNSSDRFYRSFEIPKRKGGTRVIQSPYPALKLLQRWILDNILSKIQLNSAATGFIQNKSLLENVLPHVGSNSYLKMDLKDFFPSISFKRVYPVFLRCGYSKKIAYYLASFCCVNGVLPQGAPTSPALSNIICKRLDARLFRLGERFGLRYTRYADDIAFSGCIIAPIFRTYVANIVAEELLEINVDKTRLVNGRGSKVLTGISINGQTPKLPRSTKRRYRSEAHNLLRLSIEEYMMKVFSSNQVAVEQTIGKFTFWSFIEPDNSYVLKTLSKLKDFSRVLYET